MSALPLERQVSLLRDALVLAQGHLDYTGYGDSWERECATAQDIEGKITRALEETKP